MTTLTELAAMLDPATGSSRKLDDIIALTLDGYVVRKIGGLPHFTTPEEMIFAPPGKPAGVPSYTDSIDAALALVERLLSGWEWSLWRVGETCGATLYNAPDNELEPSIALQAPTAPLAILKALVAALIEKKEADHG